MGEDTTSATMEVYEEGDRVNRDTKTRQIDAQCVVCSL